jgi:SAM-dependent methyltransferase
MTDEQQPHPDRDRAGDSTPDAETAAAPDAAPDLAPGSAPGSAPDSAPGSAPDWAHSFGGVAEAYDRGRPSYPADAVTWLIGDDPATVLELGAGTGKLTRVLVDLGHDVHATDPDPAMLALLEAHLPGVRTAVAGAEEIPLADASVDVVIAAQAFHWFDLDRALPEIARVLRPGGRICLLWNQRNERIPWVRRLGAIIGTQEQLRDPAEALIFSELFGFVEDSEFTHWQTIDRRSIQDLVLSRSNVAVLDEEGRAAKLAEVLAFYDDYGRGMDGMQLPYVTRCFRAHVLDRPAHAADEGSSGGGSSSTTDGPDRPDSPDDDVLLIDFR